MKGNEVVKVLIADDNEDYANKLKDSLVGGGEIDVIGIATNGVEAYKKIIQLEPDIALVDLVMPNNDGLWVLEELSANNFTKTGVFIMSCFENQMISKISIDLGAQYFFVKPLNDELLKRRILQIHNSRKDQQNAQEPLKQAVPTDEEDSNLKYLVSDIINRLGISPSLKGYHYIRSSVIIMLRQDDFTIGITKTIYPEVAKEYKTTPEKVERAIRHAIDSSWKKGSGETYKFVFKFDFNHKPTNGHIIANIAEYIKLHALMNGTT